MIKVCYGIGPMISQILLKLTLNGMEKKRLLLLVVTLLEYQYFLNQKLAQHFMTNVLRVSGINTNSEYIPLKN